MTRYKPPECCNKPMVLKGVSTKQYGVIDKDHSVDLMFQCIICNVVEITSTDDLKQLPFNYG